jgi:hypothetical protein
MQITSINGNGKENLHVPNSCSKWTPMKTTLQRLITRWMAPACRHGNVNRRQVLWFSVKKVRRRAPTSSNLQDHYHYHGWKPSHIPNMKCRIIPVFRHLLKTSSFTKDNKHVRVFSNRAFRITIPTISPTPTKLWMRPNGKTTKITLSIPTNW